jgi:hypothetical protein
MDARRIMPLLDHFRPPLSQHRQWESFHSAWAEALALQLNRDLLPPRYFAEVHVKVGSRVEIEVGTFEDNGAAGAAGGDGRGGVAVWAPPRPALDAPLAFSHPDVFEVQVLNDELGPHVVAAIELVSPANKDREAHRHMFAVKCASYLQQNVGLLVVDVVTERAGNLHADLLDLLDVTATTPGQGADDLYAAAYRTTTAGEALRLQAWVEGLAVGARLPTLPLWIGPDLSLPIDLEQTYAAACAARRIP